MILFDKMSIAFYNEKNSILFSELQHCKSICVEDKATSNNELFTNASGIYNLSSPTALGNDGTRFAVSIPQLISIWLSSDSVVGARSIRVAEFYTVNVIIRYLYLRNVLYSNYFFFHDIELDGTRESYFLCFVRNAGHESDSINSLGFVTYTTLPFPSTHPPHT